MCCGQTLPAPAFSPTAFPAEGLRWMGDTGLACRRLLNNFILTQRPQLCLLLPWSQDKREAI